MLEGLQLFNPEAHRWARWPAQLFTQIVVSGNNAAGQPKQMAFMVPWAPVYVYVTPNELGLALLPLPDDFPQLCLAMVREVEAATWQDASFYILDGAYYCPATYSLRTYQQDAEELAARVPHLAGLLTNRQSAPAVPEGV